MSQYRFTKKFVLRYTVRNRINNRLINTIIKAKNRPNTHTMYYYHMHNTEK